MIEIKDILKRNNIKAHTYRKLGNNVIIDNKYIVKRNKNKDDILKYLDNRNFNYYTKIFDKDYDYELLEYLTNIKMNKK